MKKMILAFLLTALMLFAVMPASAIDTGTGIDVDIVTEKFKPLVWMCDDRIVLDDNVEPGRIHCDGCIDGEILVERLENYAFEGEQIHWSVLVMDKNGIEKVKDVFMTLGDGSQGGSGGHITQESKTFCGEIPMTSTAWTKNIELPKFDPSLGDLVSAHLDLDTNIRTSIYVEQLSTESESNYTAIVNASVSMTENGNTEPELSQNILVEKNSFATVFDGIIDYGGTSGNTFPNITESESSSKAITNLSKYTASVPGEVVSFTVESLSDFDLIGPGNFAFIVLTEAGANACVTYDYDVYTPGNGGGIEANCKLDYVLTGGEDIDPACNAQIGEEELIKATEDTMAYYDCTFTVEPPESMQGEHWVTVEAEDLDGLLGSMDEKEFWFFNPDIALAIDGMLTFEEVRPGSQAYSETLTVGNDAEAGSGVLLDMFVSGTDFYDSSSSGAKCPDTNQLALTNFGYYAANGAYSTQDDSRADAEGYAPICYGDSFQTSMYKECEIIQSAVNAEGYYAGNILSPGAEISMTFRLALPEPCNGDFDSGQIFFWGEAI